MILFSYGHYTSTILIQHELKKSQVESQGSRVQDQTCHLIALCSWTSHITALSVNFLLSFSLE